MHAFVSFLLNGWVEDIGTWLLGLGCGALLAHHKIVKPARQHHADLLAAIRSDTASDSSD